MRNSFSCNFLILNKYAGRIKRIYTSNQINLRWMLRVYLYAVISYGPAESDNQIPDAKVAETACGLITPPYNILRIRYMHTSRHYDFGGQR